MYPILGEIAGWEGLLVLLIVLLLFGGAKLPGLARSMGEAVGEFRKGITGHDTEGPEPGAGAGKDGMPS